MLGNGLHFGASPKLPACFQKSAIVPTATPFGWNLEGEEMNPIDHSKATATITIDGLAICCFNRGGLLWEAGVLREPGHGLTLAIEGITPPNQPILIPKNAELIKISTVNAEQPDYSPSGYPGGCYDAGEVNRFLTPTSSAGTPQFKENIRWAVDLRNQKDVGQDDLEIKRPGNYPVTFMQIRNALAYVVDYFPKELFRVPIQKNPNSMTKPELDKLKFGTTSDLLGFDIVCRDQGEVVIDIDGDIQRLPKKSGSTWRIAFRNMDPPSISLPGYAKGDFHVYYDALKNAHAKYALWGEPSKLHSDRTDCNTVWLSGDDDNIDPLGP
jgi:hypothetical protein